MDSDDTKALSAGQFYEEESRSAVNSCILDYYKKFGRKRDLEQYFSLSTAQGDVCDPSGLFWRRMKAQYDSDSGEKKSESSTELCRISIKCSIPDHSSGSQEEKLPKLPLNTDSNSPPIVNEEKSLKSHETDNDNSDDDLQKSLENVLDSSVNKPPSPTSSINSQKKLEWDSLADVGYANEADRKASSSSLSTLERLALQQQYSNENVKGEIDIGVPTAQSTPIEEPQAHKCKANKKSLIKCTKYYKKDVDYVKLDLQQESNTVRPINVNLTKHISFNVSDNNSATALSNNEEKLNTPQKISVETVVAPEVIDKEIQTSLTRYNDNEIDVPKMCHLPKPLKNRKKVSKSLRIPVSVHLNTLRRHPRNRKNMSLKKKIVYKKKIKASNKYESSQQEKSCEPISEAESFEYMPGHIYQNKNEADQYQSRNSAGNKSSLESSSGLTTESSKETNLSFTKDLEKSIDQLKKLVEQRQKNATFKNQIVKEIVQNLVKSKYKDDDSGTDVLSGFSFNSKVFDLGQGDNTTTSTSDHNNTTEKLKEKPRKSILRRDKTGRNISSTMYNCPNSVNVLNTPNLTNSKVSKHTYLNTESEDSSNKYSSEGMKTSSEELYLKYISALKKEEEYKRYLKEKESFLKKKLSGNAKHNISRLKTNKNVNEMNELLKDLATNNYNNGSGDAFKLPNNTENVMEKDNLNRESNTQNYHSVYTLSSGNSANISCNHNTHKKDAKLLFSNKMPKECDKEKCFKCKDHKDNTNQELCVNCCCSEYPSKVRNVTDCSVQVDLPIKPQQKTCSVNTDQQCNNKPNVLPLHLISEKLAGELKYVCICTKTEGGHSDMPDNVLIYKCSCLASETTSDICMQPVRTDELQPAANKTANDNIMTTSKDNCTLKRSICMLNRKTVASKSSQGNDVTIGPVDHKGTTDKKDDYKKLELSEQIAVLREPKTYSKNHINYKCDFGCSSGSVIKPSRFIQTDLSIYPKTSDPTLSDILTVNETAKGRDCGVGIGQLLKKIEPLSVDMPYSDADSKCVEMCSSKSKLSVFSGLANEGGWYSQSDSKIKQDTESFQINIDTLKSSQAREFDEQIPILTTEKKNKVVQGVNTEVLKCCDKGMSSHDECYKGIQCCNNEILTGSLKNHGQPGEKSTRNITERNNDGMLLNDKICASCDEIEFKCDGNNNDKHEILHYQPNIIRNIDECNIVRGLCSEIPEHTRRLAKCHTYPPFKDLIKEKSLKLTGSYSNTPKGTNKTHSTDKISKKLACLKYLNEVDSKGSNTEKHSTIQLNTEEKYTNNDSRKDNFLKCKSKGANEELKELIFNRYQSNIAKRDSVKESKSSGDTSKSSPVTSDSTKDPIMALIKSITKRYNKRELEKSNRKKCFKEIMLVLNYLLDTDKSSDTDNLKRSTSITTSDHISKVSDEIKQTSPRKKYLVDRATQFHKQTNLFKHTKRTFDCEDTSDIPMSSDMQETPNESPAYQVLNRIKKECERYQKRSRGIRNRKTEALSSTSIHCEQPKKYEDDRDKCNHRCKSHKHLKQNENKPKRKCIAYNLIIQTSDSMIHEETVHKKSYKPLQNIIVKVPSKLCHQKQANKAKSKNSSNEKHDIARNVREEQSDKTQKSNFLNNIEVSKESLCHDRATGTVSAYLERNRPDILAKSLKRQDCLRMIKETRAREREVERLLLAEMELEEPEIAAQLRAFDGRLPIGRQRRIDAPKFATEHEMKKHSERIYKTLPEVTRKKEELRKERTKRTNLIMAHLFNKNLQKRTLKGVVNISNYSTIIKI